MVPPEVMAAVVRVAVVTETVLQVLPETLAEAVTVWCWCWW